MGGVGGGVGKKGWGGRWGWGSKAGGLDKGNEQVPCGMTVFLHFLKVC